MKRFREAERPALRNAEFIGLLSMIMALGALGVDLMLPAFPDMRAAFGLAEDSSRIAPIVTFYFVGLAAGSILFGPLADRFGRKPILYLGLFLYGAGAASSALAPTLPLLYLSRLAWGIGAAAPRTVALAIVRDLHSGDRMARIMSFIFAVFIIVPIIAPGLGTVILKVGPWQWVFWFCGAFALAIWTWSLRLQETLQPSLRRRLSVTDLRAAAGIVLSNRQTLGYMLAITFSFGAFISYLASSELIIDDVFRRKELFPVIFGGLAAVMGLAMLGNAAFVERLGMRRVVHFTLLIQIAASVLFLSVAFATGGVPALWVFLVVMAVILVMQALLIPNMNSAAMDPMGEVAGTAAAIIGAVSTAGGAGFGAVIDAAFDGTVTPLAVGFVLCGLASLAVILWAERGRLVLRR